ncbi:MAG TPA: hypothetical protein VKA54_20435 [Gemmatimonadaceae bacterium]|nr:hypothetical protein [Gemmatimonadaceae bacterium]
MFHRSTLVLSLGAVLSCSAIVVTGPDGLKVAIFDGDYPRALSTDLTLYSARRLDEPWPGVVVYGFTIVIRYGNPTRAPVYLWTCRPDDRTPIYSVVPAGRVTSSGVAYNANLACVGHDRPIRVGPGETYVGKLDLRGPNAFDGTTHQPLDRILEGKFRMVFGVRSCPTEGLCPIRNEALTHSNEFTVRVER